MIVFALAAPALAEGTTSTMGAGGLVGHFRMIVDKVMEKNLVSFCGEGITKTGPTTFEMEMDDFRPVGNFEVLFAVSSEQ